MAWAVRTEPSGTKERQRRWSVQNLSGSPSGWTSTPRFVISFRRSPLLPSALRRAESRIAAGAGQLSPRSR